MDVDDTLRIDTIHYQTPLMKAHLEARPNPGPLTLAHPYPNPYPTPNQAYGNFCILDTTHGVDVYDDQLMFTTMVDFLGTLT